MRRPPCWARRPIPAVPDRTLAAELRIAASDLLERLPGAAVGCGVDGLPLFPDPEGQLRGVEVIGAAVYGSRACRPRTPGRPRARPRWGAARLRAPSWRGRYGAGHPDESQDVE